MTKLKHFSDECDVLYSRENNPCFGGVQRSSVLEGFWAKANFMERRRDNSEMI